ncbi:MAG: transcription termination/antitermination protein NusA [Candidatus Azosocius agrarius]|nr:MAG: transcription termination/antitermination protein NusA [Gammaproteobacteria bacterium]
MNKKIPLKLIIDTISNEKGLSEDFIFNAIEAALISATKYKYSFDINVKIKINKKHGTYITYRLWTVINDPAINEKIESPYTEITLSVAKIENCNIKIGDKIEELIESIQFGRIAIQAAKQVIIQKIKNAERELIAQDFKSKIGHILTGTVKKINRDNLILEFDNKAEGILKKNDLLQRETHRLGDNVKVYLYNVITYKKGPQLIVNRSSNEMLIELLKMEIPEIEEGIIEIKAVARDPGSRSKIAVKTNDGRLDPIGTCIGVKGTRIQTISNELYGEKIDIILWNSDSTQFVINSIALTEIISIIVDKDTKTMEIAVSEEMVPQAIGKNGQNIKLASSLTGWKINVISIKEAKNKEQMEIKKYIKMFSKKLNISEHISTILVNEGFRSLEELAYIPKQEFSKINKIDEILIYELREQAKNLLLIEEKSKNIKQLNDLQKLQLDKQIYNKFIENNINSCNDLIKTDINILIKITNLTKEYCDNLIIKAKKFLS